MHLLHRIQRLPIALEVGWRFLSDPRNLALITPPELGFQIVSKPPPEMYAGLLLQYRVTPLGPVPMTWVSEITHLRAPYYFVDEQRIGPYALWHHEHLLREVAGGIEMEDIIHYRLPGGVIGSLVHWAFVRRQLEGIFQFREQVLRERFGVLL